jgi:hypothetical protein
MHPARHQGNFGVFGVCLNHLINQSIKRRVQFPLYSLATRDTSLYTSYICHVAPPSQTQANASLRVRNASSLLPQFNDLECCSQWILRRSKLSDSTPEPGHSNTQTNCFTPHGWRWEGYSLRSCRPLGASSLMLKVRFWYRPPIVSFISHSFLTALRISSL